MAYYNFRYGALLIDVERRSPRESQSANTTSIRGVHFCGFILQFRRARCGYTRWVHLVGAAQRDGSVLKHDIYTPCFYVDSYQYSLCDCVAPNSSYKLLTDAVQRRRHER